MKRYFLLLIISLLSLNVWADVLKLKPNHPDKYIVKRGDTLWDISGKFLQHPWKWAEIWELNPQVKNPHLIYPGDVLHLIFVDGKPKLTLNRGQSRGTIKLSPKVRSEPIIEPIPTIDLKKINSFLVQNRIFYDQSEYESKPHVLAGKDGRLAGSIAGEIMYARGNFAANSSGKYAIYRLGRSYTDPETNEHLGFDGEYRGTAETIDFKDDVAKLVLTEVNTAIVAGERLVEPEQDRFYKAYFTLSEPADTINGVIIDVPRGSNRGGANDVVVINKGVDDAIVEGTVLAIYKKGESIFDKVDSSKVQLPDEKVGTIMVFRAYNKLSYALVLDAEMQVGNGYLIRNP